MVILTARSLKDTFNHNRIVEVGVFGAEGVAEGNG